LSLGVYSYDSVLSRFEHDKPHHLTDSNRLHHSKRCSGVFYDLGMLDEEETKCAEMGMKVEPAPARRYLLMEQRPVTIDAWP
jgi:hypothetical protein